jgi:hypothetical protein
MNTTEIAVHYALTTQERGALAHALQEARLAILRVSYQHAARIAGVSSTWQPTSFLLVTVEQESERTANAIAETFQADLTRFLSETEVTEKAWKRAGISDILASIGAWFKSHFGWKSEQIVDNTSGEAANEGVETFLDDVDTGSVDLGQSISTLWIGVVPEISSSDWCRDYAGYMYPIESAGDIPAFPAHVGCIHTKVLINA